MCTADREYIKSLEAQINELHIMRNKSKTAIQMFVEQRHLLNSQVNEMKAQLAKAERAFKALTDKLVAITESKEWVLK